MIYFCTTSTAYRSAISFAVSQDIEGPYTYADTIVYSGFTKVSAFDNGSSINACYTNTNIAKLIADGTLDGLNDSWFRDGGRGYDPAYGPG